MLTLWQVRGADPLAHLDGVHDAHRQLLGGHQLLIIKEGRLSSQFRIYFTPDLVATCATCWCTVRVRTHIPW